MTRNASHIIFCSPEKILHQAAVEQDENGVITRVFKLAESLVETARTSFFDGVISTEFVSLKMHHPAFYEKIEGYQYCDLSGDEPIQFERNELPLILDFGSEAPERINKLLQIHCTELQQLTLNEILASCTYHPAIICSKPAGLEAGIKASLIQWEGINLLSKKITEKTRIRKIG